MDAIALDSTMEFDKQTSSKYNWKPMPRIQRKPYHLEKDIDTIQFPESGIGTYVKPYEFPKQTYGEQRRIHETETLRQWWIGKVLRVYWTERYFEAFLKDLNGVESVAEFDIDSVFEDDSDAELYLFQGSEFAFVVFTRHGQGSPETTSKVEFTTPYVWRKEDNAHIKELFSELFPEDEPLE